MAWTRIEHNTVTNRTKWEYRADGIVKQEEVPSHFMPCPVCQKNWVIDGSGQDICIFCQNATSSHDESVSTVNHSSSDGSSEVTPEQYSEENQAQDDYGKGSDVHEDSVKDDENTIRLEL